MRNRLIALALLILLGACSLRAQTTYTWKPSENGGLQDANFAQQHLRFAMPAVTNATTATIITSQDSGCATNVIDTVQVTAGPAPQVGEYAQATGGFQPYISEIIDVTSDGSNTYDIMLNLLTCEGFPVRTGTEQIGPPLSYDIWLSGQNGIGPQPGEHCLSAQSTVSADFLDANGVFQTLTSDAGSVSCTTSTQIINGVSYLVTAGTFNGTASNGQHYTGVTFSFNNQRGRYGWYVQSASWDPFLTGGGTGGGGTPVAQLYLCKSTRVRCF